MDTLIRNLRILWRTERLLTELRLRAMLRRTSLLLIAGIVGLFAFAMLNVAGYLYLAPILEPTLAALVVSAIDAVLAIILLIGAQPQKPGTETRMLEEVRDMALADLEAGAKSVEADLRAVRSEVEGITESVKSFAHNPMGALNPQTIGPIMSMLANLIRGKKDKGTD
ncbi:MAG: phage holin family protein [Pseudomonadota bacterium]